MDIEHAPEEEVTTSPASKHSVRAASPEVAQHAPASPSEPSASGEEDAEDDVEPEQDNDEVAPQSPAPPSLPSPSSVPAPQLAQETTDDASEEASTESEESEENEEIEEQSPRTARARAKAKGKAPARAPSSSSESEDDELDDIHLVQTRYRDRSVASTAAEPAQVDNEDALDDSMDVDQDAGLVLVPDSSQDLFSSQDIPLAQTVEGVSSLRIRQGDASDDDTLPDFVPNTYPHEPSDVPELPEEDDPPVPPRRYARKPAILAGPVRGTAAAASVVRAGMYRSAHFQK